METTTSTAAPPLPFYFFDPTMNGLAATSSLVADAAPSTSSPPRHGRPQQTQPGSPPRGHPVSANTSTMPIFPAELVQQLLGSAGVASSPSRDVKDHHGSEPAVLLSSHRLPHRREGSGTSQQQEQGRGGDLGSGDDIGRPQGVVHERREREPTVISAAAAGSSALGAVRPRNTDVASTVVFLGDVDEVAYRQNIGGTTTAPPGTTVVDVVSPTSSTLPTPEDTTAPSGTHFGVINRWDATGLAALLLSATQARPTSIPVEPTRRFSVWSSCRSHNEGSLAESQPVIRVRQSAPVFAALSGRAQVAAPSDSIRFVDPLVGLFGFVSRSNVLINDGVSADDESSAVTTSTFVEVAHERCPQSTEIRRDKVGDVPSSTGSCGPSSEASRVPKVNGAVESDSTAFPLCANVQVRAVLPLTQPLRYDPLGMNDRSLPGAAAPRSTDRFAVLDVGSGGSGGGSVASTKSWATNQGNAKGDGDRCRTTSFALLPNEPRCEEGLHHAAEPLLPILRVVVKAGTAFAIMDKLTSVEVKGFAPFVVEEPTDGKVSPMPKERTILATTNVNFSSASNSADQAAPEEAEPVNVEQCRTGPENRHGGVHESPNPLQQPWVDCVLEGATSSLRLAAPPVTSFSMISDCDNVSSRCPTAVAPALTAQFVVWGAGEEKHPARRIDAALSRRRRHHVISGLPPSFDPCIEQSYVAVLLRHPFHVVNHEKPTEDGEGMEAQDPRESNLIVVTAHHAVEDTAFPSRQSTRSDSMEERATVSLEKDCVIDVEPTVNSALDLALQGHALSTTTSTDSSPISSVLDCDTTPINPTIEPEATDDDSEASKSCLQGLSADDAIVEHCKSRPEPVSNQPDPSVLRLNEKPSLSSDTVNSATVVVNIRSSPPNDAEVMKSADHIDVEAPASLPATDLHSFPVCVVPKGALVVVEPSHDCVIVVASDEPMSSSSDANCRSPFSNGGTKENTSEVSSHSVIGVNKSISSAAELLKDIDVSSLHANVRSHASSSAKLKIVDSASKQFVAVDEVTLEHRHSNHDPPCTPQPANQSSAIVESRVTVEDQTLGHVGTIHHEAINVHTTNSVCAERPLHAVRPTLAEIVARHAVDVDVNPVPESISPKVCRDAVVPPHSQRTVKNKLVNWKSVPLNQSVARTGRERRSVHRSAGPHAGSTGGEGWNTVDRIKGRSISTTEKSTPPIAEIQDKAIEASEAQPSSATPQGGKHGIDTTGTAKASLKSQKALSSQVPDDTQSVAVSTWNDSDVKTIAASEETSDITVYGATSFVAQHVLTYFQQASLTLARPLTITLGGRNTSKLESLKENCDRKMDCLSTMNPEATGKCFFKVFVAESDDIESLSAMVKCTEIVLNCAGPFSKYSGNLVGVCARTGVDYVDITGEVRWAATMREKYGPESAKSGARIISFCGFDSVPSDIAVFAAVSALRKACKKRSVEVACATTWHSSVGGVNGGTLHTAIDLPFEPSVFLQRPVPFFVEDPLSLVHPRLKADPGMQGARNRLAKAEWLNLLPRAENIFALGVSIPFLMAVVNSKVVQASALALKYGPSFTYYERMVPLGYKLTAKLRLLSVVPALLVLLGCSFCFMILKLPYLGAKLATWFLPPGSGSSDQMCASGHAEVFAEVSTAQNKAGLRDKANALLKFQGDPGNYVTAQCVCESALTLLFNKKDLPPRSEDGFGTPSELLGFALIRRLTDSPVRPVFLETHVRLNAGREWKMFVE